MNNIGKATVIILKQPTIKVAESDYKNYIYHVTTTTQSQKNSLKAQKILAHIARH